MIDKCSFCQKPEKLIVVIFEDLKMCEQCIANPVRALERECRSIAEEAGRDLGLPQAKIDELAESTIQKAKELGGIL